MAENINISFAPNKAASESQRIADLEQYVSTLTERTKFAFASIIEEYNGADTDKTQQILNTIYQSTSESGSDVGQFTNEDQNSEIFNDYSGNTAGGRYAHVEGRNNRMDSEGAIHSYATHIEGQNNTEASRTSCPTDKKASNNHIEGAYCSSYGRTNHIEGANCFAEYDTQTCHVEGNNSRVIEGTKIAHVEGKNCVASGDCSHSEGESSQATGYASHAESKSIASGAYSHAGGLSSEASGKCSYAGGELCTASGNHSHAEGWLSIASGECSYAMGKDNTASGDYSIASGAGSETTGAYAIAHGYCCTAGDNSVAIGTYVQATNGCIAFGKYNKTTDALFVVGCGTSTSDGKTADALVIDYDGNLHIPGKVTADGGVEEIASSTKAGIVKISRDFEISEDGTLTIVKGGTFPLATKTTPGGVIVGHGFSVDDNGFLTLLLSDSITINNWDQLDIHGASSQTAGIVKIGSGITAEYQRNEDTGMLNTKISVQPATMQKAGIVKVGEGLSVEADGTLNADIYPPASLFLSGASKMMLHKYIPVESKKQGYYYGSVTSDIICDTVKYYSYPPDFPESYIVIPNWYSGTSASAVVTSNAAFKLTKPTIYNNGSTFTIKVVCEALNYSSNLYSASDFYNTTIYFVWKNIKEPTGKFPNGYITCELHLYYCDTSGTPQDKSLKTGYIPFASKAEYNAAICLTATELPTFDLSEEKYTLLVPNSLCLLSGELPSTKLAEEGVIYLTPNENNTTFKQYMWNGTEYKYLGETEHKVDAKEIGAAAEQHKHSTADITDFPAIPTKVSDLQNDSGYISEETDPTVPAWAKAESKPAYTAEEVGAAEQAHTHTKSQITDFPESLPANGGTADVAKTLSDWGTTYVTDADNAPLGLSRISNEGKNNPYTFWATLLTLGADDTAGYRQQWAFPWGWGEAQGKPKYRVKDNGTWFAWQSLPDGGNADTVDGKHASDFATAEDVSSTVSAVQIGGRNLLLGTGEISVIEGTNTADQCLAHHDLACGSIVNLEPGVYTCSADIIGTVEGGTAHMQFYGPPWETIPEMSGNVTVKTTKQKIGGTFTLSSPQTFSATGMRVRTDYVSGTITVSNMKLEKGNKPTDWTPAPEDDERRIASLEARVAALEAAAVSGGEV